MDTEETLEALAADEISTHDEVSTEISNNEEEETDDDDDDDDVVEKWTPEDEADLQARVAANNAKFAAEDAAGIVIEPKNVTDMTVGLKEPTALEAADDNAAAVKKLAIMVDGSPVEVEHVDEKDAPPDPKAVKPPKVDRLKAAYRAQGFSEQQIESIVATALVIKPRQRTMVEVHWATPCGPEFAEFFKGRTDDEVMDAAFKAIRADWGNRLWVKQAEVEFAKHSTDEEKIKAAHEWFIERTDSIRLSWAASINELRRRAAVREGKDEKAVKYRRVSIGEK